MSQRSQRHAGIRQGGRARQFHIRGAGAAPAEDHRQPQGPGPRNAAGRATAASHDAQARADRGGQHLLRTFAAHRARTRRSRERGRPAAGRPARLAAHHRRLIRSAITWIAPLLGEFQRAPSGSARRDGAHQRAARPDRQGDRRRTAHRATCPIRTWSRAGWRCSARRSTQARVPRAARRARCIRRTCSITARS